MGKRIPIALGLILVIIAFWFQISGNLNVQHSIERLEHLSYDLQMRTSTLPKNFKASVPVVIVDIDDKSLKAEGRWPWPRSKIAQLVDKLNQENVSIIAFDILFPEKQTNIAMEVMQQLSKHSQLPTQLADILKQNAPLFDEDVYLAKSLKQINSILAVTFLPRPHFENELPKPLFELSRKQRDELSLISELGYISNVPILQDAATSSGFINVFPDEDGVIRRGPLLIEYHGSLYPSLALQTIMTFLGVDVSLYTPAYGPEEKLEGLYLGSQKIRTDENGLVYIPYVGKSYTFPYYSATDVLNGNIPKDALLGKIVFVGTSATGGGDIKPTAIDIAFPGVEIQATLALGLINNTFAYQPAWTFGEQIITTLIFGMIATFAFPFFGPRVLSLIIILFPPIMFFINDFIWEKTGLVLSFLIPTLLVIAIALINMIYGYLFESRRRERLKTMFGQYVPEKHIDEMIKTTSSFALRGEDREMTVLFADIRNFTAISENLSATQLVEMLNNYLTPMTEIIFKHHGTIDKYVGDLIMAFWGAPLRDKHHARHAMIAALAMQKQLQKLNVEHRADNWPDLSIGIGINTGLMSVGDMGSKYRRNYTVLGDAVNLASRAEGLTKFYGVKIIVTESTQQHHQQRFAFRLLDRVRVKGKMAGVNIFELIGEQDKVSAAEKLELEDFQHALDAYFARRWNDAKTILLELQKTMPENKIYQIYLHRIAEFEITPPPDDWDGVYTHTAK